MTCSPIPQKVFDKAEEMAARYKQMLLEQAEEGEEALRLNDGLRCFSPL